MRVNFERTPDELFKNLPILSGEERLKFGVHAIGMELRRQALADKVVKEPLQVHVACRIKLGVSSEMCTSDSIYVSRLPVGDERRMRAVLSSSSSHQAPRR